MRFISFLRYLPVLLILTVLAGCIEENPNLVNPPPQVETVKVRFINLSSDKRAKALSLDNLVNSDQTAYGKVSKAIKPPVDSSNLIILSDNSLQELKTKFKMRFIRETNYTIFYMPLKGDTASTTPDTVYMTSTITGLIKKAKTSYIKLFNAVDDLTAFYSLNLGCPSGPKLAESVTYGRSGVMAEIRSDTVAVSLTKFKMGSDPISKLYKMALTDGVQYTLVVMKNEFGEEKAYLLNEEDPTENALQELQPVEQRNTYFRVANFSSKSVALFKEPGSQIFDDAKPGYISVFSEIEVCKSTLKDTVGTYIGGTQKSFAETSFEVLEKYTAFVFDSSSSEAHLTVIAGPVYSNDTSKGRAIVRVINAAWNLSNTSLTLSMGAHENTAKTSRYSTGEYVAADLKYGKISEARLMAAGKAPLTLFTSTNPAKLQTSSLTTFEEGHRYIIIITNDAAGNAELTIIDEETGPAILDKLPEGVFVQVVNASGNNSSVGISLSPVLKDASVPASGSLATVVNQGSQEITIAGSKLSFNAEQNNRYLFINSGKADNPDNFFIKNAPMLPTTDVYNRRVINASGSVSHLMLRQDTDSGFTVAGAADLAYKSYTEYEASANERKNSLFFIDANTTDPKTGKPLVLLRVDDISYSFGKNYSIIFCGSKTGKDANADGFDDGYYSILLQEY